MQNKTNSATISWHLNRTMAAKHYSVNFIHSEARDTTTSLLSIGNSPLVRITLISLACEYIMTNRMERFSANLWATRLLYNAAQRSLGELSRLVDVIAKN